MDETIKAIKTRGGPKQIDYNALANKPTIPSLTPYRTAAAQDVIDAGKVSTGDYAPTNKTAAMTQAVGKDANGQLWTIPGAASADGVPYDNTESGLAAANVQEAIDELAGSPENFIPSYFEAPVSSAITRARANKEAVGKDGATFILFSDPHWGINSKHSPAIIKRLADELNIRRVVCLGDALDSGEKAAQTAQGRAFMERFKAHPTMLYAFGNHDNNKINNGDHPEKWLSDGTVYDIFFARTDAYYVDDFYYYADDPMTHTRYIVLDSRDGLISAEQRNWLYDFLDESPDWNVLLFIHMLFEPVYDTEHTVTDYKLTSSASYLISNLRLRQNVKAVFCGHTHLDNHTPGTTAITWKGWAENGAPIIVMDTDARSRLSVLNPYTAAVGTPSEQAIDIVTVDYATGGVKCVRVGRGTDREVVVGASFTQHPADVTAAAGTPVTFHAVARGTGLTYQWQVKQPGSQYWNNSTVTGNKTDTISVTATAARSGNLYRCTVTDSFGNEARSDQALLTVT